MLHEELTGEIIAAFYEVYNTLGYGFLEQVYQNSLYKELKRLGIKCETQKKIKVYYKNELVGSYTADMIVEDLIVVELKAVKQLLPEHECQLVNYLKSTDLEVGLLFNFGPVPQVKRRIFTKDYYDYDNEDII